VWADRFQHGAVFLGDWLHLRSFLACPGLEACLWPQLNDTLPTCLIKPRAAGETRQVGENIVWRMVIIGISTYCCVR
jgi:hypothetical protein